MAEQTKITYTPRSLPSTGFVRLPTILAVYPVSRSSWLYGVKVGKYPQPVRLGPATVAWRVEDIRELIESVGQGEAA